MEEDCKSFDGMEKIIDVLYLAPSSFAAEMTKGQDEILQKPLEELWQEKVCTCVVTVCTLNTHWW